MPRLAAASLRACVVAALAAGAACDGPAAAEPDAERGDVPASGASDGSGAADTPNDAVADGLDASQPGACANGSAAEPPCNPALAASPWPASHRGSHAQGSSPLPGPTAAGLTGQHLFLPGSPITLAFSGPYDDGGHAIWASPLSSIGAVVKLDAATWTVTDTYDPAQREERPPAVSLGISGAYNLVDADNRFIVARARAVEVFADATPGDRSAPIALVRRFVLPDDFFCGADDVVVGMTMMHDGRVAFVTQNGVVGALPREPARMDVAALARLSLNADGCADRARTETVSNSIAADDAGGIYVVTSAAMVRVDAAGDTLRVDWRATYATDGDVAGVRLGAGSGSTPSLMGGPDDADRFVVITDGQPLMHLVLMWRDAIPDGWQPVRDGADPRIACEVPVRFGDPAAARTLSEQSVLVRGHSAIVVNNLLADPDQFASRPPLLQRIYSALEGGVPAQAPRGLERIDWDPVTRTCRSVWANTEISIPNAIPTLSEATGLIYAQGHVEGVWGLHAVRFDNGAAAFFEPAPAQQCDGMLDLVPPTDRLVVADAFERYDGACENSFYAATEVGPGGAIYQGTWYGATRYTP